MYRIGMIVVLMLSMSVCGFAESKLTPVADGIYAYVGASDPGPATAYGSNVGVIVGDNAILVVDTLMSARGGQQIVDDIRAVSDKPIKWVVNTHHHGDHTLGNCVFARLGACIVSQEDCLAQMKAEAKTAIEQVGTMLTAEELAGTEVACPTVTFSKSMAIDLGGITVELSYPGPTHCAGSCLVYIPQRKVLLTGDMLFTGYHPYLGDGDIPNWTAVLDTIGKMGAERIIPGHGPVSSMKDIVEMKTYIGLFDKYAKELVKSAMQPVDAEALAGQLKSKLPQRKYLDIMIGYNLQQKYLRQDNSGADKK
ncbi:MAG: MBL fold metallo-hydrolase [Anaerohalosphaeraceae bacterium]